MQILAISAFGTFLLYPLYPQNIRAGLIISGATLNYQIARLRD
jgi:hypothetical protein